MSPVPQLGAQTHTPHLFLGWAQPGAGMTLPPLWLQVCSRGQVWGTAQAAAVGSQVRFRKGSDWECLRSRTDLGQAHTSQPLLPGPRAKGDRATTV